MAIVVAAGVFIYMNLGNSHDSKAADKTYLYSNGNGAWDNPASWSLGRVPQDGDNIVIKAGHQIDLKKNATYTIMNVQVYGTFWIDQAAKLTMGSGSTIEVMQGGTVDGGKGGNNASSKIIIGGNTVWNSSEPPVAGYMVIDETGQHNPGTLPVKLAYFKAKAENGKVVAEWATIMEENNDFFTVERSMDGKTFQKAGTVAGAGNSDTELSYSFTDEAPLAGTSYYRLKQTDYDGKYEYFNLVTVNNQRSISNATTALNVQSVGPNPFRDTFYVNFELGNDGPVEVRLMNMEGNLVVSETIDGFSGSNRYDFNDRNGIKAGMYMLSLVQNNMSSKAIRLIKK